MDEKELLEHITKNRKILRYYYYEHFCRKCIKNKLQKKRECSKLYGYETVGCVLMDKFEEKYNKPYNELHLRYSIKKLMSFRCDKRTGG